MRGGLLALLLAVSPALAEPEPTLGRIRDEAQLAEMLSSILQDPALRAKDPQARATAQALMTEGVRQLRAGAYIQALANFLDAYDKLPSPKLLLNIASTLHDMGRFADAANTYNRYIADPDSGSEHVAEVKELLTKLDGQLTILVVRVFPRGSDVSIDGGPFISVGSSFVTRVRAGIHLVRIRKGGASSEVSVNGFEASTTKKSANNSLVSG